MSDDTRPAAELDLEAVEARANAATPGPWNVAELSPFRVQTAVGAISVNWHSTDYKDDEAALSAAAFIAHAREDVPALVARVRELNGKLKLADLAIEALKTEGRKWRDLALWNGEEIDLLKARLEKAEAVCEADARIEVLPHREWDHSPGCPKCDAIRDRNKAREAWRAAQGEGGA